MDQRGDLNSYLDVAIAFPVPPSQQRFFNGPAPQYEYPTFEQYRAADPQVMDHNAPVFRSHVDHSASQVNFRNLHQPLESGCAEHSAGSLSNAPAPFCSGKKIVVQSNWHSSEENLCRDWQPRNHEYAEINSSRSDWETPRSPPLPYLSAYCARGVADDLTLSEETTHERPARQISTQSRTTDVNSLSGSHDNINASFSNLSSNSSQCSQVGGSSKMRSFGKHARYPLRLNRKDEPTVGRPTEPSKPYRLTRRYRQTTDRFSSGSSKTSISGKDGLNTFPGSTAGKLASLKQSYWFNTWPLSKKHFPCPDATKFAKLDWKESTSQMVWVSERSQVEHSQIGEQGDEEEEEKEGANLHREPISWFSSDSSDSEQEDKRFKLKLHWKREKNRAEWSEGA